MCVVSFKFTSCGDLKLFQANPSINAGKLAQIMEAYWREFREGNPLTKKKEEEKKKEKPQKKKVVEEESKQHGRFFQKSKYEC